MLSTQTGTFSVNSLHTIVCNLPIYTICMSFLFVSRVAKALKGTLSKVISVDVKSLDTQVEYFFEQTTSTPDNEDLADYDPYYSRTAVLLACVGIGFLILLVLTAIITTAIIKYRMNSRTKNKETIAKI